MKGLIIKIGIVLLFIYCFSGCELLGPDLSKYYTPEETEYLKTMNEFPVTMLQEIMKPCGDPEAIKTTEDMHSFINKMSSQYQTVPKIFVARLKKVQPPVLFKEHHKLMISVWENFIVFTPRLIKAMKKLDMRIRDAEVTTTTQYEFQLKKDKYLEDYDKENESIMKLLEISVLTHNTAFETLDNDINLVLCSRANISPQKRGLNFLKFPKLEYNLSFQAALIPVKISINQNGEISLSCQGSIPILIGIVTIEQNIKFTKSPTLTIIYKQKKYVYSLGNNAYTFDVADFNGNVNITCTESGSIKIVFKSKT